MSEEIVVPVVMFLSVTIFFCVLFWFRFRARSEMQQTLRLALDKGHELTPEIIDRLGHPKPRKDRDLRLGILWLAGCAGLVLCGLAVPDPAGDALRGFLAGAAFPLAIGLAYLVLHKLSSRD
jgi:hypothetical protein